MAEELMTAFGRDLQELTILPGEGGIFEVSVDGETLFSKRALRRHAEPGEVAALVRRHRESRV